MVSAEESTRQPPNGRGKSQIAKTNSNRIGSDLSFDLIEDWAKLNTRRCPAPNCDQPEWLKARETSLPT
jgi:hypothetical protein